MTKDYFAIDFIINLDLLFQGKLKTIEKRLRNSINKDGVIFQDGFYTQDQYNKIINSNLEKSLLDLNRQFLHAKVLGFIHPTTGENLEFSSNLPQDLNIILKKLRNTNK